MEPRTPSERIPTRPLTSKLQARPAPPRIHRARWMLFRLAEPESEGSIFPLELLNLAATRGICF